MHHSQADSYRKLFSVFRPKILIGLTATPERMDGKAITPDFNNRFSAEIRLQEALNQQLLSPFAYFCVTDDTVNLSRLVCSADGKDNDFQAEQDNAVAWGIIAEAFEYGLDPTDEKQRKIAAAYLLEKVSWTGITSDFKRDLTVSRTRQLCDAISYNVLSSCFILICCRSLFCRHHGHLLW